MAPCTLW